MKRIVTIILLFLVLSCSKKEAEFEGIKLEYATTEIQNFFREEGNIAPVIIDWNGPAGAYTISDSSEILQRESPDLLLFDTQTGLLTWGKRLPLGTYNFSITALRDDMNTTVELLFINTFNEGYFEGGFKEVNFEIDEIDYADIASEYGFSLHKNGTVSMAQSDDPLFSVTGTWSVLENQEILVQYTSSLPGSLTMYLRGHISNGASPQFSGYYGNSIGQNNEINNPIGIFFFKWD